MQQKIIENFNIPNKNIETWKFTDLKKYYEKNNFKPKSKSSKESSSINSDIQKNIFLIQKKILLL